MPKIDAKPGEAYYYQGGMEMKEFKSKELNRTFESVMFHQGVIPAESVEENKSITSGTYQGSRGKGGKIIVEIEPVQGGITISELFANTDIYEGIEVKIKGEVTKFTSNIMGKNWVHLQDGTDFSGEYDLTVTTTLDIKEGEIVTVKGKISTDKDFGFGYYYKVIMEKAVLVE